jgi:hypothetical protein
MFPMYPSYPLYPAVTSKIINTSSSRDEYLSSLDSDTRDYVQKHTESDCSTDDLRDCVKRLHGE